MTLLNQVLGACFWFGLPLRHTNKLLCMMFAPQNQTWPCNVSSLPVVLVWIQLNRPGPKQSIAVHRSKWLNCLSVVAPKSHFLKTSWSGWVHNSSLMSSPDGSNSSILTESNWREICFVDSLKRLWRTKGNSHHGGVSSFSPPCRPKWQEEIAEMNNWTCQCYNLHNSLIKATYNWQISTLLQGIGKKSW